MKQTMGFLTALLLIGSAHAEVRVFVDNTNGVTWLKYQCTAGELVRAFALDVSVDRGQIIGISNFLRGPSTAAATGYGIFPASLRDHNLIGNGTNIAWTESDYTPVANPADAPADTLPGLGSSGLTLEFGGLWDPSDPSTIPGLSGTLCSLTLSQAGNVSVSANGSRGGVVNAFPESTLTVTFSGPSPAIIGATLQNGVMRILFSGGELQSAPSANGAWTDTGDFSGTHTEAVGTNQTRFYRVHSQ